MLTIVLCVLIIIVAGFWLVKILLKTPSSSNIIANNNVVEVKIKGQLFKLEVADTLEKRSVGLMKRTQMDADKGMLFVFSNSGFHSFWMRNTYIPLDLIWLNSAGKVVHIAENAQPCSNIVSAICSTMVPSAVAKYVIELNAGQVEKLELEVGDVIELGSSTKK